jgi:hypothetical protein
VTAGVPLMLGPSLTPVTVTLRSNTALVLLAPSPSSTLTGTVRVPLKSGLGVMALAARL